MISKSGICLWIVSICPAVHSAEWMSADKQLSVSLPFGWKSEPNDEKGVAVQYVAPDGIRRVNVYILPTPRAGIKLTKDGLAKGIAKAGGTLLTFNEKQLDGAQVVTTVSDLPNTGQVQAVMITGDHASYKVQAFTDKVIGEDKEIATILESVKFIQNISDK